MADRLQPKLTPQLGPDEETVRFRMKAPAVGGIWASMRIDIRRPNGAKGRVEGFMQFDIAHRNASGRRPPMPALILAMAVVLGVSGCTRTETTSNNATP